MIVSSLTPAALPASCGSSILARLVTARFQRLFVCLCLLVLLAEGPILRSLVLCIERDGAVNIETTFGGNQCGGLSDDSCGVNAASWAPQECECTDVSLEGSFARPSIERLAASIQLDLIGVLPAWLDVRQLPASAQFSQHASDPLRVCAAPTLVGSVVLRV